MNRNQVLRKIKEKRVIAAVKDEEGLEKALLTEIGIVFVLFGDVMSIGDIVKRIRESGKAAIVHVDLISGLSSKEISVDYIKTGIHADGIISTKQNLVKRAKELGMFSIMRFFVLDSMALLNIKKQCEMVEPDCIEILPGLMPKVISKIAGESGRPLIAGGLISEAEDIEAALKAGAVAVSSTNSEVWSLI